MRDLLQRLYTIAKAYGTRKPLIRDGESVAGNDYSIHDDPSEASSGEERKNNSGGEKTNSSGTGSFIYPEDWKSYPGGPSKLKEDLAVFGLKPPSAMREIQQARNRELKQYHSDLHMDDPEKFKAANEIMQIYNAAYERLKKYYG